MRGVLRQSAHGIVKYFDFRIVDAHGIPATMILK